MVRYQVILAYDGTEYSGFQRQANAPSVQGEFEGALRKLGWQGSSILAAGRTDAGVHASGQVAAFDLDWSHSPDELCNALNANLPAAIAVEQAAETAADFHPRYWAKSRRYRYRVICQPHRDPLRERYAWRVWPPLKLEHLQAAAATVTGRHDFAAFGNAPKPGGATVRDVYEAQWRQSEDEYIFEISANAFLYHMVRHLVHVQVEVGQGVREPSFVAELLENPETNLSLGLAPPNGLCLLKVEYPDFASGEENKPTQLEESDQLDE